MSLDKRLSRDLSPAAVNKAVLANATQQPLTVYGAATALLGGAFAALINPSIIALSALGLGATVGLGSWIWEFAVKGSEHANDFVHRYRKELEHRRQEALESLVSELTSIGNQEGLRQIHSFRTKYDIFVDVLDRKLTPGELTYNRYLSIAEQVFLGGLDNLESAAIALKSISAIDIKHLESEISRLQQSAGNEKLQILEDRLKLRDEQIERVEALMLNNEKALTQLDQVSTKIAMINTQQGRSQMDLEDAMKELRRLIQRADNYSES